MDLIGVSHIRDLARDLVAAQDCLRDALTCLEEMAEVEDLAVAGKVLEIAQDVITKAGGVHDQLLEKFEMGR